jgi:DNA end-binding protein Ku
MAERLIDDMATKWDPKQYHDTYRDDLMKLIEEKAAGHPREATPKRAPREAEVIDFAKLLERSLASRKRGASAQSEEAAPSQRATARGTRKATAAKTRRKAPAPRGAAGHRRAA